MSLETPQMEHITHKCVKCKTIIEEYDVYFFNSKPKERLVKNYKFRTSFRNTPQGNICFKCINKNL